MELLWPVTVTSQVEQHLWYETMFHTRAFFFLDGWFYCLGGEENAAALELEFSTNMES